MGVCRELLKNLKKLRFQWAYTGNYNEKKLYHIVGATREVITKTEFYTKSMGLRRVEKENQ